MDRPARRQVAAALTAVLALAVGGAGAGTAAATATWTTYHGDASRSGVDPVEASLAPAAPAWTASLGAAVYGQPVVADGRVFAATEANRVVALDPHTGQVLWSTVVGAPLTGVASVTGCGNIDPLGITSTPVVDPASGTVYVVGEVSTGGGGVHHQLVGLDPFTGAVRSSVVVDPPLPAGEAPVYLLQRAALALGSGRVYVSYGGNSGDCGSYHGWVVGVSETGPPDEVSFEAASTGLGGAVWEAAGPAVDAAGDVYVTTGNANPPPPQGGSDPGLFTESVVKLSPALVPLASYKDQVAGGDQDLASDGPTLLANGELFAVGKSDVAYLLRTSDLGLVARIPGICGSDPDGGNAYDAATGTVFVPCRGGGIQEVHLATATAGARLPGANSAPILVGGELWAAQYPTGGLTGYDAGTGATLQTLATGPLPTFASPSAALGLLLVGTTSGVAAFDGPSGLPPAAPPAPPCPRSSTPTSYRLAAADGGVFAFEGAPFCGSAGGLALQRPVVGSAVDPTGGSWLVTADGGVFAYGAPFSGSLGGRLLVSPIVGMAATPDGGGYWLVAADGGVFAFGDAAFSGSLGGRLLVSPIVGMAATPDGGGYWLVAADGGVFAFGDAAFSGSLGGRRLVAPIVAMAATLDGGGYWLVAADGGVFAFGDAAYSGSLGGLALVAPVVGMASTPDGGGYWLAARDGGVFAFGDAAYSGSLGGLALVAPVVGMSAG